MTAPITVLFGVAAVLSAAFGLMELRMLARFLKNRREIRRVTGALGNDAPEGDVGEPPTVTIQIPLYNERTAAEQIVRAAAAQTYPADRFDIQVLDDSTDETTEIVARVTEQLRAEGVRVRHLHRAERDGYKAGALAEGLEASDAEFVAVFDADFVPDPDFLRKMLIERRVFDDATVAFAQARWAWDADERKSWLTRVLSLLLDRHFLIQKPVRAWARNVTTFNGSGGIWRRAAIDDAGGWASDTLTEDLDLSYRCALNGWRGRYLEDVKVVNELPNHVRAFKLQQRRWAKGTAQCLRKLIGRVMGSGDRVTDRWEELTLLAGYAIHPLLLTCLFLWPWAVLYVDRTLFWVMQALMALGIVAAAVSMLLTARERDGRLSFGGVREVVSGLMLGVGIMINNTVGQLEGLVESGGEFVRTPKKAHAPTSAAATPDRPDPAPTPSAEGYATPLHWTFFAEVGVMVYCAWGLLFLVQSGEPLWAIAMGSWGLCIGLVVVQQIVRSRA